MWAIVILWTLVGSVLFTGRLQAHDYGDSKQKLRSMWRGTEGLPRKTQCRRALSLVAQALPVAAFVFLLGWNVAGVLSFEWPALASFGEYVRYSGSF